MKKYKAYLSIGDSMSIDTYPFYDLSKSDIGVSQKVGAASLLFENKADIWPEFIEQDLLTFHPGIKHYNFAMDGATTFDFLEGDYLKDLSSFADSPVLITLTICGNDLLRVIKKEGDSESTLKNSVSEVKDRFVKVLSIIQKNFAKSTIILTTIYDPTDDTGKLPGYPDFKKKIAWFKDINDFIRGYAQENNHPLADVHHHFLRHGLSAKAEEQWFWEPNPIEPSAKGASEIRRVWIESLKNYNVLPLE